MYKINLKNYIHNKKESQKLIKNYYSFCLKNFKIFSNINIQIYFNIKNTNSIIYINKICYNTLFINSCRINFKNQNNNYYFVTNKSWNPKLSKNKKINSVELPKFHKYFNYQENYKINNSGSIYIIINNTFGWFINNCKITYNIKKSNYKKMLLNLIIKIRKYTNRKIKIRLHPKDIKEDIFIKRIYELFDELKCENLSLENKLTSQQVIEDSYCVFIQNSKFILDFVNKGVPIYNLDFFTCNYFPEIQIKDISIINNLNIENLPDRIKFLKRFYYHVILEKDNLIYESIRKLF